jgi:uncharacterized protein YjiS (DUF1127 family)
VRRKAIRTRGKDFGTSGAIGCRPSNRELSQVRIMLMPAFGIFDRKSPDVNGRSDEHRSRRLAAPAGRALHWLRARATNACNTAMSWVERSNERHELRSLSDRTLKDVGMSRADAEAEACKPFWRR